MAGQSWEGKPRASADASQEARKTTRSPQCPGSSDCRERDGERSMSAFSHSTRGLKSKSKVAAWLVSDDSSLLSYRWPLLTMSSHGIRREKGSERGWEREGENKLSGVSSCCLVAKSCPTLCDSVDCGLPGSSVHGISQARILDWVAICFSRRSSQPKDRTCVSCIGRQVLYHRATRKARCLFLQGH